MGDKGDCHQGTHIKDTRIKPNGGKVESRRWRYVVQGGVVEGKWRQLYLKNNKWM